MEISTLSVQERIQRLRVEFVEINRAVANLITSGKLIAASEEAAAIDANIIAIDGLLAELDLQLSLRFHRNGSGLQKAQVANSVNRLFRAAITDRTSMNDGTKKLLGH